MNKDFNPGDKVGLMAPNEDNSVVQAEVQCRLDDVHWLVLTSPAGDPQRVHESSIAKIKSLKQWKLEERERRRQRENAREGKQLRTIADDDADQEDGRQEDASSVCVQVFERMLITISHTLHRTKRTMKKKLSWSASSPQIQITGRRSMPSSSKCGSTSPIHAHRLARRMCS